MVLRIFRDRICRPSKFPKPKFNVLHVQKSTSSDQPPDEVARCKECQRIIDPSLGSQRFDDPNNIKRPTLCIAHTSVFDASKDNDANTETLLENLQKKLASQAGLKQNIAVDEAQKNASGEVTAGTKGQEEHYKCGLQANVWQYANINNSDNNKDDKLLQRPERIEDRGETEAADPPHLPSHIRYRFEADTQLDELAKKYLNMKKDLIDNRLSEEMERLTLPINPSEAMRPSINVNVSCEEETFVEVDVPKPDEPPQKEVINSNPQYYEQTSWCNLYFKPSRENESKITSSERDGINTHKAYVQSTRSEEMLPLHCCLDFDPFDKSYETNISVQKSGFEKHDDIIPFHQLQCMEFTDLDLRVKNDKINSVIQNLNVEEGLPNHLYLQGHLIDDFTTAPNTIQTIGLYDFITYFDDTELVENTPKEQITDVFHSLMSQDMDVTKFDYAFPRDSEVAYTLSKLTKGSDTSIQIQNQTMPNKRGKKKQALTNIVRPKFVEQIDVSKKLQTATNDIRTNNQPTNPHQNPKTDAELRNFINSKVMEQICAPTQRYGRLVQSTQEPPSPELTNLIHTRVLEQVRASPTLKRTTHSLEGIDAIVQVHPPKEAHIDPFIERKVMKDNVTCQKEEAIVKSTNQDEPAPKLEQKTEQLETQQTNLLKSRDNNAKLIDTAEKAEETKHPSRGTETMVQSCVQTVPSSEAQKVAHQDVMSIPKTIEDVANNLTLDMNLSLSELLRRVRARNRLQYLHNIKEQVNKVSTLNTEKICPPGDRPQCPPPPDCTRPCAPPSKPKCPPEPPKCPPDPPKCPPDPPKCPPEPPKCPPPKEKPKCPPDPPKCPPAPKPKCPCPCPPSPKCPPAPPKCPCSTADNPEGLVTIDINLLDAATIYLKSIIKLIKTGFLVSWNTLLPAIKDTSSENATLNLNRIKDFEPWTPIPSWPFPVNPKKRKLQLLNNHEVKRGFCKTEWTKPKHEDKRHTERRSDLPSAVQNTSGHEAVRYGELWKAWFTVEHELFNAFAKNVNFYATCSMWGPNNNGDKNTNKPCDISNDGDSKRQHVDAIIRTYSELQDLASQKVKKSGLAMIKEKDPAQPLEATLNATTKNVEEEKLTQKLETIEEVPLVEADPDIVKPPKTSGPVVMNTSSLHNCEEFAKNSDFQVGDDPINAAIIQANQNEENRNLINNYFEREGCQKPNFNDLITLSTDSEINANEEISLTELMQRVRQRNRLLRCRDINQQLNATTTGEETTMDQGGNSFPQHQNPQVPPGWGWPSQPQHQPYRTPFPMYPHVANPHPQKAEPITPDSRPGYNRASKVNPVTLALYLGPLVTAFRNAAVLFTILITYIIY